MYHKYEALIEEKGISTYAMCKETGLNPTMFSDWKSGRAKPKVDKLMIIAEYFGKPLEYFLKEEKEVTD